jgi:hypothetical protein
MNIHRPSLHSEFCLSLAEARRAEERPVAGNHSNHGRLFEPPEREKEGGALPPCARKGKMQSQQRSTGVFGSEREVLRCLFLPPESLRLSAARFRAPPSLTPLATNRLAPPSRARVTCSYHSAYSQVKDKTKTVGIFFYNRSHVELPPDQSMPPGSADQRQ